MLKKCVESVEYMDRANTVFQVPNPIISGRHNVRLSVTPTHETVGHIIKLKSMNSSICRGTGNQFRIINRYCVPKKC